MKTFLTSQFKPCPLAWISHSTGLNNRINHLHEHALRTVYQVKIPVLELCLKMTFVTIHTKNLHYLVNEIYKAKNDIYAYIMKDLSTFLENNNYLKCMRTTLFINDRS